MGLTTAQARSQSSYSWFDFNNDWVMFDGTRPFLRAEWSTSIRNAHQLQLMALDPTASYTLVRDFDASETAGTNASGMWSTAGFNPIGDSTSRFTGTFDGLGHTIIGLTINRLSEDDVGLLGFAEGATIRNVGLEGGSVTGKDNVGGLVGYLAVGTITTTYATGAVTGSDGVGGLVWNKWQQGRRAGWNERWHRREKLLG